jgi:hypothetical protein
MKIVKLLSSSFLALVASLAIAGQTKMEVVEVVMNGDGSGEASGDMVTARTSKNQYALIGCGIKGFDDSLGPVEQFGFCQADVGEDDTGSQSAVCFTENIELLEIIKAIGDNSYIRFDFDAGGFCTRIDISTQSFYLPRNVKGNK